MPVKQCKDGDKPGRKYGDSGKCYPCKKKPDGGWDCTEATKNAVKQGIAMGEIDVGKMDVDALAKGIEDYFDKNIWKGSI